MCRALGVSPSGYYYRLKHPISRRAAREQELLQAIAGVYSRSRRTYGTPRITAELRAQGITISRRRVAALMRKAGLKNPVHRKYRAPATGSPHSYPAVPNYLNRDFTATGPGRKWVSDLTYIRTGEGWLYLTVILDLFDRKIIGWALSRTPEAKTTSIAAWQMAVRNRPLTGPLLFHSDRGAQYACHAFRQQLRGWPVLQSMNRKGNCLDNAVAESFFKTLKTELAYRKPFPDGAQAEPAIVAYINWYNCRRRHSALGYVSPSEFGNRYYYKTLKACFSFKCFSPNSIDLHNHKKSRMPST